MYNFDSDVINWNGERGFLDKPFNLSKETGYLISEVLESLDWDNIKNTMLIAFQMLDVEEEMHEALVDVENHDDFARWLCKYNLREDYNKVDYCDMITDLEVFGVGGRRKMGIDEDGINDIRKAVMDKNHTKKPGDVDEHGKQMKGTEWTEPEVIIEGILNSIEQTAS